jgi:UDP-N-acetylmuramoylalanine--D-glutamate ligase
MEDALHDLVEVFRAPSLDAAVSLAKTEAKPGDVVLLSPACASFDMFKDFNHRGELFSQAVKDL